MVELLAPAGDFECLKAGVLNGANAVYIGGKEFSARQFAGNFDREEMIEAVRFCHSYNVKVYVTMNTLYRNEELNDALKYAAFLYETGVDALIIQDIGFLKLLREQLPDFELHGSTQMSVHNLEGVNKLYEMGLKRVVLARELTLKEIEHIVKNTKAEIEVFVHGAICISFSGQCLFSSMIGGRSGNRGRCAQSCRQEYIFDNDKKAHYLSPKDLSTLEFIKEISKLGVASIKIEGRMKKPEYVSGVVSSYKKALNSKVEKEDLIKVNQLFNRGGFTTFNLVKRQGRDMMSYERPKNWGSYLGKVVGSKGKFASIKLENSLFIGDGIENFDRNNGALVSKIWVKGKEVEKANRNEIAEIYLENAKAGDVIYKSLDIEIVSKEELTYKGKEILRMPLWGAFRAIKGEKIKLSIKDQRDFMAEDFGDVPQIALKTPTSRERVFEALNKTKDTNFYFENLEIEMDEDIVIPVSELNQLRRNAIDELVLKLQNKRTAPSVEFKLTDSKKNNNPKVVCVTGNIEAAKAAIDGECDILFFGGENFKINKGSFEEILKYNDGKILVLPHVPEIILEDFEKRKKELLSYKDKGIEGALCGNLGMYSFLMENDFKVFLSSGFNIFNSEAVGAYENSGAMLSLELNLKQLKDTIRNTTSRTIAFIHGKTKVMVSRHCFIGSVKGHGREGCPNLCEGSIHYLKDKMGEVFEVVPDIYCRNHIFNSKILCTIEHIRDIINLNADYLALSFLNESYEDALLTVKAYKNQIKAAQNGDYNLTKESKQLLVKYKGNITKGHFYRGVQ